MNELEKLLSDDLHAIAGTVDIPVSLDTIVAEHEREVRRAVWTRRALVTLAVAAVLALVWAAQSVFFRTPDRAVPNPLQSPSVSSSPTATPSPDPTTTPTAQPTQPSPDAAPRATPAATSRPSPAAPSGTAGPAAPGVRTVPAIVYFLVDDSDGPRLVREERRVTAATPAQGALEAMIAGPRDPDYSSPLPRDTRVRGIAHRDGVITVDFSAEARGANVGASGEAALVQQIAWTLTRILEPGARVRVLIEGQPANWGHEVWDQPVALGPAMDVRYLIGIDAPEQGAEVGSPVVVRGEASVYEATLHYEVVRADGSEVLAGFTNTTEGLAFAPYEFSLDLEPGVYTVTISETDPSGGDSGIPPRTDSRTFTVR